MTDIRREDSHPSDSFLLPDVFPTVWCPGCGIGTAIYTFFEATKEAGIPSKKIRVISGIGCTGKINECLRLKSYSVTDGTLVDFALRIKRKNPDLIVCVFMNNADSLLTGAKHLMAVGASHENLLVIYLNNFIYSVSRNQAFPLTPYMRKSVDGCFDLPFNIPGLAEAAGANYIARWTPLRAGWMKHSIKEAFYIHGLSVIEMIAPCLIYDANSGSIFDPVDRMKFYHDHFQIRFAASTAGWDLREDAANEGIFRRIAPTIDIPEYV